ncbi:hypothetical protein D9M69_589570 [compost metagenome]
MGGVFADSKPVAVVGYRLHFYPEKSFIQGEWGGGFYLKGNVSPGKGQLKPVPADIQHICSLLNNFDLAAHGFCTDRDDALPALGGCIRLQGHLYTGGPFVAAAHTEHTPCL